MSLTGGSPVLFTDVGKAMKDIATGKPALSDDPEYDAENVQEPETQSMIKTKYVTIKSDELDRTSSEPINKCNKSNMKNMCFGICAAMCAICLIMFLAVWIQWMDEARQNEAWLKKDVYNGDRRRLTVFTRRHKLRHRKCTDFEYGCCHVYYSCDISDQGELISDTMTVSPYSIVQHNEHGTNCPRLLDMISGFNDHYPEEEGLNCAESEFGCCDINYSCDIRMRFSYLNDVNHTKNLWLNDLEKNQTRTSLTVAKRDVQGSNCPRLGSIIYKYERGFPIEISEWWFIGVVCIVVVCAICSTRKRK